MIELNKTYQDKSGNSVRIICVDRKGELQVIGLVGPNETPGAYMSDGRCPYSSGDLILPEDYSTYVDGEKVMVRDNDVDYWNARNFARVKDGKIYVWAIGTAWQSHGRMCEWIQCRRPTAEELGEK